MLPLEPRDTSSCEFRDPWLTEEMFAFIRYTRRPVDGDVVNWDAGQCEGKTAARVEGVGVERQYHDEETNQCKSYSHDQRDLGVRKTNNTLDSAVLDM